VTATPLSPKTLLSTLAAFLVLASSVVHAQNTDETDTAPGGMGEKQPPAAKASPSPSPAAVVAQPAGASLIPNGDFEAATEKTDWPDGWSNAQQGLITREAGEEDGHFMRLLSQEPGQLVQMAVTIPIPAGVKGLEFFARFRTANVKFGASFLCDARTMFRFQDDAGNAVGKNPPDVIFTSHAKNWTDITRKFLVPDGATKIVVSPSINKAASGTLDLEEVRLAPMDPAEAEAMAQAPLLAEKKKAEDEAEIQKILALPSQTQEIKVSGNKLVTADGKVVQLQGVNVPSLEWSAKGENILRSIKVAVDDWKANAIRLPVMDTFWFGKGKPPKVPPNDAEAYRKLVDDAIKMAAARGAYVILDLHRFKAPEEGAVEFWKDAAARYKNNPAVLFDIFNEPTGISWEVWRNGGPVEVKQKDKETRTFQSPGMQGLVEAVRSTGANNIIVASGVSYAYDLSGVLEGYALEEKGGNGIVYATHFYNWHKGWDKKFLPVAEKYPILVGEFGADINKMSFIPANNQEDPYTWVPDALGMIQKYNLNWTGFSFHPKATPVLLKNWDYEPTPFWGSFVKEALAGKQFEMKKLR